MNDIQPLFKKSKAGGCRPGAGRPRGTGKFREKTSPVRIPHRLLPKVQDMLDRYASNANLHFIEYNGEDAYEPYIPDPAGLPLYSSRVAAGFPAPVDDCLETRLDLNHYVIKHPSSTFYVRVKGDSMIGAGIHDNDILVVDRSLKPIHKKVIIAVVNGELTVKRLSMKNKIISLVAENENYPPIMVNESMDFSIWGVVTTVIHPL